MAVKIDEDLQRWDYETPGKKLAYKVDVFALRESATRQSSGTLYAAGWGECADAMNVEEPTARRILRQLACSEYKPSEVNSCYDIRWLDVTKNELLPVGTPFESLPSGCEPMMFEDPEIGNQR